MSPRANRMSYGAGAKSSKAAAREVLDRVLGKSQVSNHVTIEGKTTVVSERIVDLTDEQLLAIVGSA
jgi:hypothetical protein